MVNTSNSDHYHDVLLEEIRDSVRVLGEAYSGLSSLPDSVALLQSDVAEIKSEMQLFRALWRDHEGRITKLEATS